MSLTKKIILLVSGIAFVTVVGIALLSNGSPANSDLNALCGGKVENGHCQDGDGTCLDGNGTHIDCEKWRSDPSIRTINPQEMMCKTPEGVEGLCKDLEQKQAN